MVQTHPWLLNPQWKCPSSKCPWGTWGEKQQDFLNSSVRFFSTTKRKRNKSSQEGRCQWVFWQVGRAKFAISVVAVCYSLFYWIAQTSQTPACLLASSSTNLLSCSELRPCLPGRCRNKALKASHYKMLIREMFTEV